MKNNITRRGAMAGMGLFAGAAFLESCAVNPVTGKRELMLMGEDAEINMGKEAHGQIVEEYGAYNDSSMQEWFTERGNEMTPFSHRKHLPWQFTVLDSPVINAFAVPGGNIYVTRGILAYFNNEAQFAGVLGHELGHVTARHTAARYSKAKLANLGLSLGSVLSEEFAKYADLASLGSTLMFLKFSRNDERQADKLGVEYSSSVGYDARQVSEFFVTLERLHPGGGSLPSWQSTHPDPGDRINATRKMANSWQQKKPGEYFVKRNEYLDRINGIVFGNDPRQGYVKNGIFYHPEMKFKFPAPKDWQLNNQPKQVTMSPEKQDAVLIFNLADGANPKEAAAAFAEQNGVTVASSANFSADGVTGFKQLGQMAGQQKEMGIASYFIPMHERIYVFHGLSAPADLTAYEATFTSTAKGFGAVKDQLMLNVSPGKLDVRAVKRAMTVEKAFNSFDVPEDKLAELAVINGLELGDSVSAGTRLKIIL